MLPSRYGLALLPREHTLPADADFQDTEPNGDLTPLDESEAWRHSSH
jgi:hypothetical protein